MERTEPIYTESTNKARADTRQRIYQDGTVKPPTVEDIRNRIATARAWGDVTARAIIQGNLKVAKNSLASAVIAWQEASNLLELLLESKAEATNSTEGE